MKKSIITILFLCCLMGTVTASAAQVKDAETVSPAVAAMACLLYTSDAADEL